MTPFEWKYATPSTIWRNNFHIRCRSRMKSLESITSLSVRLSQYSIWMYNTLPLVAAEVSLSCVLVSGIEASESNEIPHEDVVSSSAFFFKNCPMHISSRASAVDVLISSSSSEYSSSFEL